MSSSRTSSTPTASASYKSKLFGLGEDRYFKHKYLIEVIGRHVSHTPALVSNTMPDLLQELLFDLSWCHALRKYNEILNSQETD